MDQVEGLKHDLSLHKLHGHAIGQCHVNQLHDTYSQLKCDSWPLSSQNILKSFCDTPKLRENKNFAYAFMCDYPI